MSRAVSATLTLALGSQAWVTASNHFGEPVKNPPNVADFFLPSSSGRGCQTDVSLPAFHLENIRTQMGILHFL
ncbi:hypothetical protein FZO59_20435 [Lelliottia nimipressuralis]|uniref:Secreted protein n=1 Tax=Lelliottia nimipressuralis TaxID=69220 RepID=A0ABY3NXF6_9ENTR|nr:hypothetical protein ETG88_09735 [Lelliottia nimipressuralis]TYT29608.1 hypothetical protein FZO59_20435 [Lelliottia nimipressuralis]